MTALVMPNVFVIPPEEDNDPPFCCFDATYPRERYIPTEEDLEATGSALEIISRQLSNKSPIFHRGGHTNGVVMPRRSDGRSIEEVRGEDYQDPDITIRDGNPPGNDSEIIEVIKVRRHTQDERENQSPTVSETAAKSSKSLKSRASRAFNSLKNVGRSVSCSRIIPDVVTSDAETSRAPSPTPSRRGSMIFSLFSHSPSLESRSSFDSFNESPPSSVTVIEASTPEAFDVELHSPSSAEMQGFVPYSDTDDDGEGEDDMETTPRAPRRHCPSPALHPSVPSSVPKLNRRRFSVLSLFTVSKDSEHSDAGPSTLTSPSIPTLDSLSQDSLGPSRTDSTESSSSSGPTTPVDEAFPDPLPNRPSISMLKRLPSFSRSPRKKEATPLVIEPVAPNSPVALGEIGEQELSFGEIRLDSLHFDELSFDAGRF